MTSAGQLNPDLKHSRTASRFFAILVFLATCFPPAASQVRDPPLCAFQIVDAMDALTWAVYDIIQAATDCTLPNFVELSCAADLTDMFSWMSGASADIAGATWTCGNLDNGCAQSILFAFGSAADTSNSLVASASDCVSDPFICTYDVVTAVDSLDGVVGSILLALSGCRGDNMPFLLEDFDSRASSTGFFERRLSQASSKDDSREERHQSAALFGSGSAFSKKLQAIRQRAEQIRSEYSAKSVAVQQSSGQGKMLAKLRDDFLHKLHLDADPKEQAAAFSAMIKAFKSGPFEVMAASKTAEEARERLQLPSLPAGSLLI